MQISNLFLFNMLRTLNVIRSYPFFQCSHGAEGNPRIQVFLGIGKGDNKKSYRKNGIRHRYFLKKL